ncbi:sugar transferase [Winogradskyella echinorum]|uniref:Sugar transferase n=1 Tax=Winogradskyella echinorum TaxID=538189 RepID=A0ABR6Y1T4_9FLAO|nr:sugar transferase [Winogradskyella echinorum]MBC3846215.1 sugar transferase [Winogradskyella echinorum]MBC5750563.1 sugar transferase [Winogradskyella echinorum]
MKLYPDLIKRFFDFFAALVGLLIVSPLLLILIIVLAISNNGKPFFYQLRSGKNGKLFTIIKLKTMNDKTDSEGNLLPVMYRITKTGDFCRKYSLDEIPQLINILKGDMSLVGPRPLLPKYLPLYNKTQFRRHEVTPGITGWAQVNGRNAISWEQKFEYDVHYVDNQSFALDLKIIFMTIDKVINRKDVNNSENDDMPIFTGTKE